MSEFREFHINDRRTEDEVLFQMDELCSIAVGRGKMTRSDKDLIMREASASIGGIMRSLENFLRGSAYATVNDLKDFAFSEVNRIIDFISREIAKQERYDSRSGYDRYNRYDRNDNRLNVRNYDRRRRDESTVFGLANGLKNNEVRDVDTDKRRTARDAKAASQRGRAEEKAMGYNKQINTPVDNPAPKQVPQGVDLQDAYAIVGTVKNIKCPLTITEMDVLQQNSELYTVYESTNLFVDNAINISVKGINAHLSYFDLTYLVDFLIAQDPTLIHADIYCHVVQAKKLTVVPFKGKGNAFIEVMHELKKLFIARKQNANIFDYLAEVARILTNVDPQVRTLVSALILRKWNAAARCLLAAPNHPFNFMTAATMEDFLRLFSIKDTGVTNESLRGIKDVVDEIYNMAGVSMMQKVHGVAEDVCNQIFGKDFGAVDVKKSHAEYIVGYEPCTVSLHNKFTIKDLYTVPDSDKDILLTQFRSNYVVLQEEASILFTNMDLKDMLVHDTINKVTAEDIPAGEVIKSLCHKRHYPYILYHAEKDKPTKYISTVGVGLDNALMFTHQPQK